MDFRGPLFSLIEDAEVDGGLRREPFRLFASAFPSGTPVEVELRAGRNGIVIAVPVEKLEPVEAPEMPRNEELRPVPPEARTTPMRVDDFVGHG